jgi:glycosyltransferase involved in cell wall biosynthesis
VAKRQTGTLLAVSALPLYPLDDGIALRCFNLLEQISARWPTILVAPTREGHGPLTAHIPQLVEHRNVALDGRWPVTQTHFDAGPLRAAAAEVLRKTEIAAAVLWPGAETLCLDSGFPASVVDRIDSGALIDWRFIRSYPDPRMKAWFAMHAFRVARFEWKVARAAAATVLVGEDDAAVMGLGGLIGRVHVVPNGVKPFEGVDDVREAPVPTLVFTGVLDYEPNTEAVLYFARAVWPAVRRESPEARFIVAGRRPTAAILALDNVDGIEVRADVPSVGRVLREGWLAVAPMQSGSGLKNKILEAWVCGRPVVATPMATNGLELTEAMSGLVTNDAARMAASILSLLGDHDARRRHGVEAVEHARGVYGWDAIGAGFAAIVDQVIAPRGASQARR